LRLSFVNKCDEAEHALVAEYFQRCFDQPLFPAPGNSPAT
jgi:cobaltochelatase CobS